MSILLNEVHSSWKLGEWIASLMNTGNCFISSLTIAAVASLLKLDYGITEDHPCNISFLQILLNTGQMSIPTPMSAFYIPYPAGWWYKYVPLETSNFVAIWYVISHCVNASFSKTPDCSLANILHAVLATCSCALFCGFVRAFCLCDVLATCSYALFSGLMLAILLCAVSATCSCALFSGFVHAIHLCSV